MDAALAQLKRQFGANLDADVLQSVLEICGGDVTAAVAMLQADNNGGWAADDPVNQRQEGRPADYFNKVVRVSMVLPLHASFGDLSFPILRSAPRERPRRISQQNMLSC
jgi:hypothetical protein